MIGIYCLLFKDTDKVYIGKSINLEARKMSHLWQMRHGKSPEKLQEAYNKFGEPDFQILELTSENNLNVLEKHYIEEFDSCENGFNSSRGGEAGNTSPGELNGRALYSNDIYKKALELLVNTTLSRYEIAKETGLTVTIISKLSSCDSHKWLAKECPDLYTKLVAIKNEGRSKRTINTKRPFNAVKSPEGIIYDLSKVLIKDFCKEYGLSPSKLSLLLNAKSEKYKGWVASDKISDLNRSVS